jgi:hypothetical protein
MSDIFRVFIIKQINLDYLEIVLQYPSAPNEQNETIEFVNKFRKHVALRSDIMILIAKIGVCIMQAGVSNYG